MSTKINLLDDDWLRQWTIPEGDRAKYTSQPWRGEARWFRPPNVVCLETWRKRFTNAATSHIGRHFNDCPAQDE
jgi:hypothetical protein